MTGFKANLSWKRVRPLSDVQAHLWVSKEAWDGWIVQECKAPVDNKFTYFSVQRGPCYHKDLWKECSFL